MTSLSEIVSEFNLQLLNFMEEMQKIYCDDEIITNTNMAKQAIAFNAFLLIDQFALLVYPLKDKIHNQDENFFLKMDINSHIKGGKNELSLITKCTKIWHTLDSDTKQSIFDYMKVLVYYTEEYLKKKLF